MELKTKNKSEHSEKIKTFNDKKKSWKRKPISKEKLRSNESKSNEFNSLVRPDKNNGSMLVQDTHNKSK